MRPGGGRSHEMRGSDGAVARLPPRLIALRSLSGPSPAAQAARRVNPDRGKCCDELFAGLCRWRPWRESAPSDQPHLRPRLGTEFPWGTLHHQHHGLDRTGLIAGYLAFKGEASQPWRLFLMTGILGGYTTFRPTRSMRRCSTSAASSVRGALRRWFGGTLDCRAVCRPRAGAPVHLNEWPAAGRAA